MLTGQDLGNAIKAALKKKGMRQKDLADHFGIKAPSVSDWLKYGRVSKEKIPALIQYFSDVVDLEYWGFTQEWINLFSASRPAEGYVRLEHMSPRPAMGIGALSFEPEHVIQFVDVLELWARENLGSISPSRIKVLTAVGQSMKPTIQDKDIVFVDTGCRNIDSPDVYVLNAGGRLILKRVRILSNGTIIVSSDNKTDYPDEERYSSDDATESLIVCGKAVAWWTLRKS